MPSSNYDYWREREELQRQHNIRELDEYNARVAAIYQMMIDMATQEINAFYGKYASAEGITIQEAKARISKLDIEEYARKAAEYVKNHDLSESANAEMRLYNATMKINRLELLKANIGLYMCGGFSEIEKMTGMKLDEATMAEFERLAGILGKTINNADKRVDSLVNASFQNATYSDRIWMYQDALKDKLSQLLTSGMIQGKSPAELARELRKEFDVSRHQSERLMRTELCRVQTEAQKLSYEKNGYRKYIFLALGANPCEDCLENDGQVFKVDEMSIAVNAPPMHPNCMCSTAPYFEGTIKDRVSIEENSNKAVGLQREMPSGLQSILGRSGLAARTVHAKTGQMTPEQYLEQKRLEGSVIHICKLDTDIYKCVSDDITTDEVIITKEQIKHINERHSDAYEKYGKSIAEIISAPDYILKANREYSAVVLKEFSDGDEQYKAILRLKTSRDDPSYKNSIITFMRISDKEWQRLLRNGKILYRKKG